MSNLIFKVIFEIRFKNQIQHTKINQLNNSYSPSTFDPYFKSLIRFYFHICLF